MAEKSDPRVGPGKEFPSDWHRDAYVDDVERELAGADRRVSELKAQKAHPDVIAEAEEVAKNARAELRRFGHGQKAAARRPRTSAKKESRAKKSSPKKSSPKKSSAAKPAEKPAADEKPAEKA